MTVLEYAPAPTEMLDFINDSIRNLKSEGCEAAYILTGTEAYDTLCQAMSERFKREAGSFETYQFIPIVVDPSRTDSLCILPKPGVAANQVAWHKVTP